MIKDHFNFICAFVDRLQSDHLPKPLHGQTHPFRQLSRTAVSCITVTKAIITLGRPLAARWALAP